MTNCIPRKLAPAILFASLLGSGAASAVLLQVDLDEVGSLGFFNNPDPNYSVGVDLSLNPISYTPGTTLAIDIEFVDLDGSDGKGVGASQFLQVFDLVQQIGASANPPQDINVFLGGNIPSGLANLAFQITFTGVSGTISGTTFAGAAPFCNPGVNCSSGVTGADLIPAPAGTVQDDSFLYHDFHITFSTDAGPAAFDITSLSFGGAADAIQVSAVPEPATLGLLSLGVAALGFSRRRQ